MERRGGGTRFSSGGWPGLSVTGEFRYDAALLSEVRTALEREVEALRSTDTGAPSTLERAAEDLRRADHFGRWQTAAQLRHASDAAARGSLAIARAITANLTSFVLALRETYANYQRSEDAAMASIMMLGAERDLPRPPVAGDTASGTTARPAEPDQPPAPQGQSSLPLPVAPPRSDDVYRYDPDRLRGEIRRLLDEEAWRSHYEMSRVYRAASDFQQTLGESLRRYADDLAEAWQSEAAAKAQRRLQRIHATVLVHEVDLRTIGVAANATGEALEEALRRPRVNPSAEPQVLINQLNVLFLDALRQYPTALRFDLPYGGPDPAELEPPREPVSQWQDMLARAPVYPPAVEVRQAVDGTLTLVRGDGGEPRQADGAPAGGTWDDWDTGERTGTALVRISALGVLDVDQ